MTAPSSPDESMESARRAGRSTVYGLFRTQAKNHPLTPAVEWCGRVWTYGELLDAVDRLTAGLRFKGVVFGDRIAVLSENRIEYLLLQLSAARMGAIVACLNWRLAPEELQHCMNLAEPRLLFCSARFAEVELTLQRGAYEAIPIHE